MSKQENLYTAIWRSNSTFFKEFLEGEKQNDSKQLDKNEFTSAGNRREGGYVFRLELENGQTANNVSGSAVARDLRDYLVDSSFFRNLLQNKKVEISMGKDFTLKIKKQPLG